MKDNSEIKEWFRIGRIEQDAGRSIEEVALQHLRHEGETAGSPEVTLHDLNLISLSQILDIERTGNVQLTGNAATDFLDGTHG